MTYRDCIEFLGKRESKKFLRNTYIERHNETTIVVRFHRTNIVYFYSDGRIKLNAGGFWTKTTKDRMNYFIPGNIFTVKGDWFLHEFGWSSARRPVEFFNGMILDASGFCINYFNRGDL